MRDLLGMKGVYHGRKRNESEKVKGVPLDTSKWIYTCSERDGLNGYDAC
jgi:hypothetical protein